MTDKPNTPFPWKPVLTDVISSQWSTVVAWPLLGSFLCLWSMNTATESAVAKQIYDGAFSGPFFNWYGMVVLFILFVEVIFFDLSKLTGLFLQLASAVRRITDEMVKGLLGMLLMALGNFGTLMWFVWQESSEWGEAFGYTLLLFLLFCFVVMLLGFFGIITNDRVRDAVSTRSKWWQRCIVYPVLLAFILGMWKL